MDRNQAILGWHQVELATKELSDELHKTTPDAKVIEDCLARGAMVDRIFHEQNLLYEWTWQSCLVANDLQHSMVAMIRAHPDPEKLWDTTFHALMKASDKMVHSTIDVLQPLPPIDVLHYYLIQAASNNHITLATRLLDESPELVTHMGNRRLGEHIGSVPMFELFSELGYQWLPDDLIASAISGDGNVVEYELPQPALFKVMRDRLGIDTSDKTFAEKAWNALLEKKRFQLSKKLRANTLEIARELIDKGATHAFTQKTTYLGALVLMETGTPADQALDCLREDKSAHLYRDIISALRDTDPQVERDSFEAGHHIVLGLLTYGITFEDLIHIAPPCARWAAIFWMAGCEESLLKNIDYDDFKTPENNALRQQFLLNRETGFSENYHQDPHRL